VLNVAQVGDLDVRWSRKFSGDASLVTITKSSAGRYHVSLMLDQAVKRFSKANGVVGIDMGFKHLATLSTGEKIQNHRYLKNRLKQMARLQKSLSRRKPESKRREKQRLKIARLYERIGDQRRDYLHKTTTDLVKRFGIIAIEDLYVHGIMQYRNMGQSTQDASVGTFCRMLEYKCNWYGRKLVKVDRWFPSSKRCNRCGFTMDKMPLEIRAWTCPECGTRHDRDINAAKNILAVGLTATAQGGHVRRKTAPAVKCSARRTANSSRKERDAKFKTANSTQGV
jgi:putative transposase